MLVLAPSMYLTYMFPFVTSKLYCIIGPVVGCFQKNSLAISFQKAEKKWYLIQCYRLQTEEINTEILYDRLRGRCNAGEKLQALHQNRTHAWPTFWIVKRLPVHCQIGVKIRHMSIPLHVVRRVEHFVLRFRHNHYGETDVTRPISSECRDVG